MNDKPEQNCDALREQVSRLNVMLSTVSECFKIIDAEGRLIDMNAAGLELIEADSLDDVRGVSVLELVLPEYHEEYLAGLKNALRGNRVTQEFKIRGLCGTERWMQQVAVALPPRSDEPAPSEVAAFTRDVTATHEALESLRAARDEAEAANRAKSDFLANMSHEIRTPMSAILGHLELIDPDTCDLSPGELAASRATIRRSAAHLLSVIDDILNVSKIEAGKTDSESVPLALDELVVFLITFFSNPSRNKCITFSALVSGDLPGTVLTDPTRLQQALINLIGNAVKFTESGTITLEIMYDCDREQLTFVVRDSGIGMSADQLSQVRRFEAFSQADTSMSRKFGGTGLGLRITADLATAMGGSLEIDSTEGAGTTCKLTIHAPLAEKTPEVPRSLSLKETHGISRAVSPFDGKRVLIAEDGRDNQRLLVHHLSRAGADVTVVENGRAALEAVKTANHDQMPQLVLMDMQMPEVDGYEATRSLRASGCTIPIVALTAHAMNGDRERCLNAGCDDYLSKPISRDDLLAACTKWLAQDLREAA